MPVFLSYVLSFIYVGIYWNNHHHLLQSATEVSGPILWANMHLLFWLSLYGVVLLMAAIAYMILTVLLIRQHGAESKLAQAIGSDVKGKISIAIYVAAILFSFLNQWLGFSLYIVVAIMWFIPDRRIELSQQS